MSKDHQEATQEPTLRRLQQAKEEGRVARSSDLASVLFLIIVVGLGFAWFTSLIEAMKELFAAGFSNTGNDLSKVFVSTGWQMLGVILVPCIFIMIAATVAGVLQVGGLFVPSAVAITPAKMNLSSGLSRLFGARARMQLIFSSSKLILASLAVIMVMVHHGNQLLHLGVQKSLNESITSIGSIGLQAVIAALCVLLILGICDYFWQRYAWKSDLRMTRQEIIEEHREQEGTTRQARQHASWVAKKNTASVKPSLFILGNDVVISIRWNATSMSAPIVLDVMWGDDCGQAVEKAKSDGIPVEEDHALALQIANSSDAFLGIPSSLHGKIAGFLMIHRRDGT